MENKAFGEIDIEAPPKYSEVVELDATKLPYVDSGAHVNNEQLQYEVGDTSATVIHVIQPSQIENRSHNGFDIKFAFQFPQEIYCHRCSSVHMTKTFYSKTSNFR